MERFLLLIVFLCLSSTDISALDRACKSVYGEVCITKATFKDWNDARKNCKDLGGDLTIPNNISSAQLKNATISENIQVWVGGRTVRVWITDNSKFYFGKWNGCVDDIGRILNWWEVSDLSECLQSCSRHKFAYFKRSLLCSCSEQDYAFSAKIKCVDPFEWKNERGENTTHKFRLEINLVYGKNHLIVKAKKEKKQYKLQMEVKGNYYSARPMCQFDKEPKKTPWLQYGSSFLWTNDNEKKWGAANSLCQTAEATLVKLDWESPLFTKALFEHQNEEFWLAVDHKWLFIDGSRVASSEFNPPSSGSCLAWGLSGLTGVKCQPKTAYPAACTLPQETTVSASTPQPHSPDDMTTFQSKEKKDEISTISENTSESSYNGTSAARERAGASSERPSSVVGLGVGISVGLVAVGVISLVILWRVRRKSRQSTKASVMVNERKEADDTQSIKRSLSDGSHPVDPYVELYSKVNKNVPGKMDSLCSSTLTGRVQVSKGPESQMTQTSEDPYNKLDIPKVIGSPKASDTYTPTYSVASLDVDHGGDASVTPTYDHPVARGKSQSSDNNDYDLLDIPNVEKSREADTSSLYNHVIGIDD